MDLTQNQPKLQLRQFQCPYLKNEMPGRPDGRKTFGNQQIPFRFLSGIKAGGMMLYRLLTGLNLEYWHRNEETGHWVLDTEQKPDILIMVSGVLPKGFITHTLDQRFDEWLVDFLNTPKT